MQPADYLYRSARATPAAPAIVMPGRTITYGELVPLVDALAAAIQELAPEPGAHVGIACANHLDHLLALIATLAAERVWVPLNPLDGAPELRMKAETAAPALVFADPSHIEIVGPAAACAIAAGPDASGVDTVSGLLARFAGRAPVRRGRAMDATQAIKFTGGSSGRPKAVMQPVRAWLAGVASMIERNAFTSADRYLIGAPLTHGASTYVTPMLAVGGALVLPGAKLSHAEMLDAFRDFGGTAAFLPPTRIYGMMEAMAADPRPIPSLRLLIYGGAPMPADRIERAQALFGPVLCTNYGQTEAPQIICGSTPQDFLDPSLRGTVGRPGLLTRVEVMGPDGAILPPGEAGEIVLAGDLMMTGYLGQPEETAKTIVNGWLHTGDVGVFDDRGYLTIVDRLKDLIITGGFNVYPNEVEAALVAHPAVREASVFAMPDHKWGEAVWAAVELVPGGEADAAALIAHVKAAIGSVKAPKTVRIVDALPRNAVGKVVRRDVRAAVTKA